MRVTLIWDSVHVTELPMVLDCIADTANTEAVHDIFPTTETREATVRRMGAEHYTITKGPMSLEQSTRILSGLEAHRAYLEEWST